MSHAVDEYYEVYDERCRSARKPHTCNACKEIIQPGHRYFTVFIVFDGRTESLKRCARCQEIHEHLRDLGRGDTWPDERLGCGLDYMDEWGREPPPEIQELAFLDADEMQRRLEVLRAISAVETFLQRIHLINKGAAWASVLERVATYGQNAT